MDEIKAVLREESEIEDSKTAQIYDVGHYDVIVMDRKDDSKSRISVSTYRHRNCPKYLPFISVSAGKITKDMSQEVWVSTISYGNLRMDEICLFMEAMQTGIDTARYIQRVFVDPINNGTWNWTPQEP